MPVGFREKRTNKENKDTRKFVFIIIVILAVAAFVIIPLLTQMVEKTNQRVGEANAQAIYSAVVDALGSDDADVMSSISDIDGEVAAMMLINYEGDPANAFKYKVADYLGPSFAGNIYVDIEGDHLNYYGWENGTGGLRFGHFMD